MKYKNRHATELGRLGGKVTRKRYGLQHFRNLGKKGSRIRWQRVRDREHYIKMTKKDTSTENTI
jgi:hypothetical protein